MLVFPLGLGTKLRWTPVLTLGIIALWIGDFLWDPFRSAISEDLNVAAAQSGIKDTSRNLFVEYCLKTRGIHAQCTEFSKLIWAGFPAKTKLKDLQKIQNSLEQEFEKSLAFKDSLKDCADSERPKNCIKYKEIFWKFSKGTQAQPVPKTNLISNLPSYRAYAKASADFGRRMVKICQINHCLIKGNIELKPILLAQIRHGSLMHLLGNLIAFLIFSSYVEQRLRPSHYGVFLLLSGSFGMLVHALVWGSYDSFIIGGSTLVSGAVGLFYVLFFHHKLCLRVFIPRKFYLGTNFYAPIKYVIPLMFIMSDIAGGLNSGYNEFGLPRVAHFAHLSSFVLGALLGWILLSVEKSKQRSFYRDIHIDLQALKRVTNPLQFLSLADQILSWDPHQDRVRLYGLKVAFEWLAKAADHPAPELLAKGEPFCRKHLPMLLQDVSHSSHFRKGGGASDKISPQSLVSLFNAIPPSIALHRFLPKSPPDEILNTGFVLLNQGSFFNGVRMFDLFLSLYPDSWIGPKIENFVRESLIGSPSAPIKRLAFVKSADYQKFVDYYRKHPPTYLKPLMEPMVGGVDLDKRVKLSL